MNIQLLENIKTERSDLKQFLFKAILLLLLLIVADRLSGKYLLWGLETYYGLDRPAEILLIGHSHTVLAVDKELLEDLTGLGVAKYARQGANAADRLAMVRQYLDKYGEHVNFVIYDVDAYSFASAGLSANSLQLFYPFMDEKIIKNYISQSKVSKTQLILPELSHTARFSEVTLGLAIRGWFENWSNFKSGTVDVNRLKHQITNGQIRKISFDNQEIESLEQTLREVTKRGIPIILAFYPTIDLYNDAEPIQFKIAMGKLSGYAKNLGNVYLFDFLPEFHSRNELFYDPIHMNQTGQKYVTHALANKLNELIDQKMESID